jgi:hypothetical protein
LKGDFVEEERELRDPFMMDAKAAITIKPRSKP